MEGLGMTMSRPLQVWSLDFFCPLPHVILIQLGLLVPFLSLHM